MTDHIKANDGIKPATAHLEDMKLDEEVLEAVILKSDLDNLSAWQTMKRFWKVSIPIILHDNAG